MAHGLHERGRRRVIHRSGWVGTPNAGRATTARFINPWEDRTMKWTKPEAEIVAVTMEVTAYVATL
jgi:coenzyme PQQ precursor peptide PqqA